ncbi:MAG: HTH domain-containing protein [Eubacterium sp.]|nr:HTH domain-containing protein [Eubacterium sp.]
MDIINFIPHGKINAVSGKELKQLTGCDERTIKQHIANARLKGTVICSILDSNRGGYFIPESPAEAVEYVRTEQCRIQSAKAALKSAADFISDIE